MMGRSFSLKPFLSDESQAKMSLTCSVERRTDMLSFSYLLSGPLAEIVIPAPADFPSRKYGLWEETCFEFFIGTRNSDTYWEFNLSPAGNWNVYLFTSYRQGMQEEQAFTSLPLSVRDRPDALRISLELDMKRIVPAEQDMQIALSAVIKERSGKINYWALTHPGPKPDFHRKEGFIIEV